VNTASQLQDCLKQRTDQHRWESKKQDTAVEARQWEHETLETRYQSYAFFNSNTYRTLQNQSQVAL